MTLLELESQCRTAREQGATDETLVECTVARSTSSDTSVSQDDFLSGHAIQRTSSYNIEQNVLLLEV